MIDKKNTYAVVGASKNPNKYGYKVLKDLKEAGFKVISINPREKEILGIKSYPNLSSFKANIDVVIFVVPPKITEKILREVKDLNIKKVWLQPGAESKNAIKYCHNNNIECVSNACIMVRRVV